MADKSRERWGYPDSSGSSSGPTSSGSTTSSTSSSSSGAVGCVVLLAILVCGGIAWFQNYQQGVTHANATATAQVNDTATSNAYNYAYAATATAEADNATRTAAATATFTACPYYLSCNGTLAFFDPLDGSNSSNWSGGAACQFSNGAYHVTTNTFNRCVNSSSNTFNDFAFEVQMSITQGDCGGIIFRDDDANSKFYLFTVCQDGSATLYLYVDSLGAHARTLKSISTSLLSGDLTTGIAVLAKGSTLDLYVEQQQVFEVIDNTYSGGQIGLVALAKNNPTDVAYTQAKMWTL